MSINERILSVITYYKIQRKKQKGIIKKAICKKCDFNGGTFQTRMDDYKYSEAELEAIERIIEKHKNGELEHVEVL